MDVHKETCACTHMLKRTHGGILFSHKREGILPFLTTQINLDGIKLNEIRQPQKKQILYDLINMWNLKMSKSYKQKAEWFLPVAGGWGKWGVVSQTVQSFIYAGGIISGPNCTVCLL